MSLLTLITCPPATAAGFRLMVRAGELLDSSPWAAPGGTRVEVAELFFNTPARRKFLKSPAAEQAQIVETMRHLALGYPEVHFTLKTPARVLLERPGPPGTRRPGWRPSTAAELAAADAAGGPGGRPLAGDAGSFPTRTIPWPAPASRYFW